jgi:hypothetical protein
MLTNKNKMLFLQYRNTQGKHMKQELKQQCKEAFYTITFVIALLTAAAQGGGL